MKSHIDLPLVSIVLCTYNNQDTIRQCLSSLVNQTYPRKEIIVVNDGSTDKTGEFLREYVGLRVVHSSIPRGWSKARNDGLRLAEGDILFFAESDAVYDEDYVSKAVECLMGDPNMAGVQVMGEPWKIRSTFVTECIEVENRFQHKRVREGKMKPFYAWVLRRDVFEALGGFDERLIQGEDKDLFLRIRSAGYSIGLVPGVHWRHRQPADLPGYVRKCVFRGKTRILFLVKHRRVKEVLRSIGLFWAFVLLLTGSVFSSLALYALTSLSVSVLVYELFLALHQGWNCVERKKYLFLLPFFKSIRHMAFAVGYTWGSLKLLYGKLTGAAISAQFIQPEERRAHLP